MVSNSLRMELQELLTILQQLCQQFQDDPDYQEFRRCLPAEWPM